MATGSQVALDPRQFSCSQGLGDLLLAARGYGGFVTTPEHQIAVLRCAEAGFAVLHCRQSRGSRGREAVLQLLEQLH